MYRHFDTLLLISGFLLLSSCKENNTAIDPDTADTSTTYYQEQHRNQYHFSPEANWMNDPNGMVYHDGEYHLFYQYYPDSTVWGPMHWGHAVSPDMVHWEHLPIAIYPDSLGYIFSGSAVIDSDNTAGFGTDAMIAIFTYHDIEGERSGKSNTFQYQGIAYSTDRGRTFTKYEGNPVIPNPGIKDFRDPKVIWDVENKQWVLVLAAYDKAMFYTSTNLKDWSLASEFGIDGDDRLWECPDLFPIRVTDSKEQKWVLITSIQKEGPNGGTATSYFVGDWDGKQFIGDATKQYWLDYGTDNYAAVTWANAPIANDEKYLLGWMSNWQYAQVVPSEKWRSAMTLPRKVSLHKEQNRYRLRSLPVAQLDKIETETEIISPIVFKSSTVVDSNSTSGLKKIDLRFNNGPEVLTIKLSNTKGEYVVIGYNGKTKSYFIDRSKAGKSDFSDVFASVHHAPVDYTLSSIDMTIYVDNSSIELFADGGRTVMTDIVFPTEAYTNIEIASTGSGTQLIEGSITKLEGIW